MKNLYLILNLGSILVPFLASFHPRLKFYKKWKSLAIAMIITNLFFIPWDIYFTKIGIWGFNNNYYLGNTFFGLPIEEWLFFICIPYACVFMHYALLELFPKLSFSEKSGKWITTILFIFFTISLIINYNKWYPFINYSIAIGLLSFVYLKSKTLLFKYYKTFIVMLVPFIIVNGILTGTGIVDEIVWYNNSENMGVRFLTIPVEDITYAFTLILLNLFIVDYLEKNNNY